MIDIELAEAAARWWATAIVQRRFGRLAAEGEADLNFRSGAEATIHTLYARTIDLTMEQVERFQDAFQARVMAGEPNQFYSVDFTAAGVLAGIMAVAGIPLDIIGGKIKMSIEDGEVIKVSEGYGSPWEIVSRHAVRRLPAR